MIKTWKIALPIENFIPVKITGDFDLILLGKKKSLRRKKNFTGKKIISARFFKLITSEKIVTTEHNENGV